MRLLNYFAPVARSCHGLRVWGLKTKPRSLSEDNLSFNRCLPAPIRALCARSYNLSICLDGLKWMNFKQLTSGQLRIEQELATATRRKFQQGIEPTAAADESGLNCLGRPTPRLSESFNKLRRRIFKFSSHWKLKKLGSVYCWNLDRELMIGDRPRDGFVISTTSTKETDRRRRCCEIINRFWTL